MMKLRGLIPAFMRNVRLFSNMSDGMDPKDKTVLITGGARGIGRAAVEEFLSAGSCPVIFNDCNEEEGSKTLKSMQEKFGKDKVKFVPGDVTVPGDVENVFKEAGCPDLLICSAALSDDVNWERSVDVTVTGCILTVLTALKYMGPGAAIIIRSSSCAFAKPFLIVPVYITNRYAVTGFGLSMGDPFHFKSTGIRIILLCPGLTTGHSLDNFEHLIYKKEWIAKSMANLQLAPKQGPEVCSKAMLHLVKNAAHGSVWVIENCKLWLLDVPDRHTYSEFVEDL